MKSLAIIPARFQSTRFPGKPLATINGKPMIQWVYEGVLRSNVDEVIVAIDDERIAVVLEELGINYLMTDVGHENGTSRIIEVTKKYNDFDCYINVQGDEPLIQVDDLNRMLEKLKQGSEIVSVYHNITEEKASDENVVKVVMSKSERALYFSRSKIPFKRGDIKINYTQHVGIYGFNQASLQKISKLDSSQLQIAESLEQLAWLENDLSIDMLRTTNKYIGVDTSADLDKVAKIIGY